MAPTSSDRWFFRPRSCTDARIRLFCFPYAGAGAAVFRAMAEDVGSNVDLLAVQLPGRGARYGEPPIRSMSLMTLALARAIEPLLDRAYAFFGYSNGALLAFELARELRRRRLRAPSHLFLAAKRAPHLPAFQQRVNDLPQEEFIEVLRAYGGTPIEILEDKELLSQFLPTLRADFALSETHRFLPEPALDCDASLFGSMNDPFVPYPDLLEWQPHFLGRVEIASVAGGHFFLHDRPRALHDAVAATLARLQARETTGQSC